MRDTIEIPTANPTFLTLASSMSPSDCANLEMATRPPKPEIFISLEPRHIRPKFAKANLGFTNAASSKMLCSGDCNNDRQPEIAIIGECQFSEQDWLPKRLSCHIRMSPSQLLGYTFIEFVIVKNAGFAVGILMISVIFLER